MADDGDDGDVGVVHDASRPSPSVDEISRSEDRNIENQSPPAEQTKGDADNDNNADIPVESISAVSILPVSNEKRASRDREAIDFVRRGSALTKIRSRRRHYQRQFYVDDEGTTLLYRDSHKSACFSRLSGRKSDATTIRLKHVKEIRAENNADESAVPAAATSTQTTMMTSSTTQRMSRSASARHRKQSSGFTLIVGEELKTLDFVARDDAEKRMWIHGLTCLIGKSRSISPRDQHAIWLSEKFHEADKDGNGTIQYKEIVVFMQSLNFCPKQMETLPDIGKAKAMSKAEFIKFFKSLSKREELKEIFKKYATTERHDAIGPPELVQFFRQAQNEDLSENDAESLIRDSEPCPELAKQLRLSVAGFHNLFATERMNIRRPLCRKVYQDMTQPLNHFFVNSSHNTYLEGHQLYGVSSVEQYIRVLTHRCRCVELDVWDGSDGEPIIYHGYTLTTKIAFRDVLEGIRDYAFVKTQYPLILSLENHCSIEQQRLMARYLRETFESRLLTDPLDDTCTSLPSPEQLKNKVIVKGKKLPADVLDGDEYDDSSSEEDEAADIPDDSVKKKVKERSNKEQKHGLATELSDCVVICQSAKFKSFATSAANQTFANISSFSEDKALKLGTDEAVKFVRHNAWQMSRTYPAGRRMNSSNYNPIPMWNVGCQVVALNFQTRDEPLLLNYGRFQDNGNCGYVLKPKFMRSRDSTFDPEGPFPHEESRTLTVCVISGFGLPKKPSDETSSILDPYVKVLVHGVPGDCDERATRVIANNGFHPIWNETLPPFHLSCPDLAIISFQVYDSSRSQDNDIMVAQDCLPFSCIQTGYRMLSLRNTQGYFIGNTSLFVHTSISH